MQIMNCNVCANPLGDPLFESASERALTSLCELMPGRKRVWCCARCAHLQGEPLPDTRQYYATDYRILLDHDDEDQIYEVHGDRIVYRTEHQVTTLLKKLRPPPGATLLDYGCAKASTPNRLLQHRPDLHVHLFDVSEMYTAYWDRFIAADRRAVHQTPADWQGRFDVVTSFFALEHIPSPHDSVRHVASLLKDDGVFYGIVPDTFGNVADFVVIDHVNHFTAPSLFTLLQSVGFPQIDIDADAHRGALVFTARKSGPMKPRPDLPSTLTRAEDLAGYWRRLTNRIRSAEDSNPKQPAAIYGSGFYGAYIASTLRRAEELRCFLDRSPFRQGKSLSEKPVLAPEQLPQDVRLLYIGLNPAIARDSIAQMPWLAERRLSYVFLDEGDE
jgi:SAM-dependent methyltransferase